MSGPCLQPSPPLQLPPAPLRPQSSHCWAGSCQETEGERKQNCQGSWAQAVISPSCKTAVISGPPSQHCGLCLNRAPSSEAREQLGIALSAGGFSSALPMDQQAWFGLKIQTVDGTCLRVPLIPSCRNTLTLAAMLTDMPGTCCSPWVSDALFR